MKAGFLSAFVFGFAFSAGAYALDASQNPAPTPVPPPASTPAVPALQTPGVGPDGWQALHPGGGSGMNPGRGLQGIVTAVAANHYTIKTGDGETFTIEFSANTRILKQPLPRNLPGQPPSPGMYQRPAPQQLKPTDIKVGDSVAAIGPVNATEKSLGAILVMLIDPERAKMLKEMQANYGKTWLQGRVTAVSGVNLTVQGSIDNAPHTVMADENTIFRRRRDPITLADIRVGEMMRAEGALKDGNFVATRIMVMGMRSAATPTVPQGAEPAQSTDPVPQPAPR